LMGEGGGLTRRITSLKSQLSASQLRETPVRSSYAKQFLDEAEL